MANNSVALLNPASLECPAHIDQSRWERASWHAKASIYRKMLSDDRELERQAMEATRKKARASKLTREALSTTLSYLHELHPDWDAARLAQEVGVVTKTVQRHARELARNGQWK